MEGLKILSQDDEYAVIGGYGVIFGGKDLDGETFTAETDFMLDLVPVKLSFIDHSEDTAVIGSDGKQYKLKGIDDPIGRVIEVNPDDTGLYMQLQLDKAGQYWPIVEAMIASGKSGLSTGTVGYMARRKGTQITRWPIVETSITMTPAEPRTAESVRRLKHVADANPDLKALFPETAGKAVEDSATDEGADSHPIEILDTLGGDNMSENKQEPTQDAAPLEAEVKSLNDRLNQIMELLENAPALKQAGYTTDDGGAADPTHKSFGDFLLAIKRKDAKRLATVYKAYRGDSDAKDLRLDSGEDGGYLVPEEYLQPLLQVTAMNSPIYQRVTRVPVSRDAGSWPALDQFLTPTAGSGATALAGGITAATKAAGSTLTETDADFTSLSWRVNKVGGYVEVENELVSDSPQSIEALLRSLFGIAIGAKNERNILRGSGAGEPTGILNADCTIGVTTASDNAFSWTDALAMFARFKSAGGSPVWIIHPGVWPDIGNMETTNGGGVWQANQQGGLGQNLMGYPIIVSEHMPQDDYDDVILADLSAYVFFERQALSIAFSEHAAFTADKGTWRFTARNDGMPWLKSAITLADPQGSYTVSPFVYHND